MRIFWNKNVKITSASGATLLNPHFPPAAWGSAPDPTLILLLTIENLSISFLALSAFYYPQKRTK